MTRRPGLFYKFSIFAWAVVSGVAFQNCSSRTAFNTSESAPTENASGAGNGDGYGGKLTIYNHYDSNQPCLEKSMTGQPLPNDVIFMEGQNSAQLVRESCRDVVPSTIPMGDLTVETSGQIRYRSLSYSFYGPGGFGLLAASCPSGYSPKSSTQRANLMASPFDLADLSEWGTFGGMLANLEGALGGLPGFRLTRTKDATNDPTIRLEQYIPLDPDTTYAFSFLARTGSSNVVSAWMYGDRPAIREARFVWNIDSGSLIDTFDTELFNVSSQSVPFAEGRFFTVYFKTPSAIDGLDFGIASGALSAGESIFATGVQLEDVSTFCVVGP